MSGAQADAEPLDANCVVRRLWIGSKPPVDRALPAFSMIVLAAKEYQPASSTTKWRGRVLHVPLDDAEPTQQEILRAVTAAREVAAEMRRGGRVLVSCWAGLNRSAWISAQAILMTRPKATPAAAIRVIRARRDAACLSNPFFVKSLENLWSSRTTARP